MGTIPVFAGLGSDKLFVDSTSHQALRDARRPYGQILVETCYRLFTQEVTLAVSKSSKASLGIDLEDFPRSQDIIVPLERYRYHPIVQHSTLCLVQLLRYQSRWNSRTQQTVATSGYCAGLFPAIAAATAETPLQFLVRAEECFRAAVMLGIAIQRARKKIRSLPSTNPWSLVVGHIEEEEMLKLIQEYSASKTLPVPIYISGKHASNCIIISSEGEALRQFAKTSLPSTCVVRPTNVFALYHDCSQLQTFRDQLLDDFETRQLSFPSRKDLLRPLISTADGSLIQRGEPNATSRNDLLPVIFDMILLQKTDWVAVQEAMATFTGAEVSKHNPIDVCNFGPGYGAHEGTTEPNMEVQDVSQDSADDESQETDIAIVGFGVDLPDASDPEILWKNLMDGISSCSEIPPDRFHISDYLVADESEDNDKCRSMKTKFGNFMKDPFSFDNQLFGISPREAASIDPQQRVMLQTAYRALENAGYVPDSTPSFARETFGCFVGNSTLGYVDNLKNEIDVYYSPGTLRAFMSGRISYAFQWSGPSITLDTACSSSLVAIHQAAQALAAGDCRAAVAGGVNVITSPDMYLGLDRAHFLSPTGQCKAFDESADGYCRSEGCAAFVLKRLDDAVQENDRILGVIKGIAMNQSGQSTSITHPHPPTQGNLFRTLLEKSSMQAEDVSVVEAHGTGTQAGDPNELSSIREVFAGVHVGSIKSNIGHCEAASGGAALAKLLMMLRHKRIPPQALLERLNPAIKDLASDGTIVSTKACHWESRHGKRRTALLNNFGAAGSNAALILQEHVDSRKVEAKASPALTYVFGCSARSVDLLEQMRKDLIAHVTACKNDAAIADMCYTSTARRGLHTYRLSTTASSMEELATGIKDARIVKVREHARPVVFLFSGQGSQYLGMGEDLYHMSSRFRTTVDRCHDLLTEWGFPSCLEAIRSRHDKGVDSKDPRTLQAFQSGIYVLEVALAYFLIDVGIQPTAVAGHSLGEYAALVVAGVLDIESGLWLVSQRAKLIVEKCELWQTSMLAVDMSADRARQDLLSQDKFAKISVSCDNSPSACVLGGDIGVLKVLKEHLSEELGRKCALLDVPVAYHTSALDPVLDELTKIASQVCLSPPSIAIASNVLGKLVEPGDEVFNHDYFAEHCRSPVAFDSSIEGILKCDNKFAAARWIEVGPHPALLPMITSRASNNLSELLPTMKKKQHASRALADLFASCYRDDLWEMDWRACFEKSFRDVRIVDLPPAPMNKERYYIDLPRDFSGQPPATLQSQLKTTPYTVLGYEIDPIDDAVATYHTPIESLTTLIKGHVVCGKALCPASVYVEMAFAAISHFDGQDSDDRSLKLSNLEFSRPLLLWENSALIVRTTLLGEPSTTDDLTFEISSLDESVDSSTNSHCTGVAKWQSLSRATTKSRGTERTLARRKAAILKGEHQTFTAQTMYQKIFSRVVEYSSHYQAVQKIHLDDDVEEIFATCELPAAGANTQYAGASPVLLDTMLHVAGFAANFKVDNQSVCICHHVRSIVLLRKDVGPGQAFEVHCSNFPDPTNAGTVLSDAHAIDTDGEIIAIIKGMAFQRTNLARLQTAFEFASTPLEREAMAHSSEKADEALNEKEQASVAESPTVVAADEANASIASAARTPAAPDAMDILSKTTGVKREDMTPSTDLRALGVDSMMIFELDKRLKKIEGQNHTVAQLTAVRTVGDFEELTSAAASRGRTPVPKARASTPRRDTPQRNSPNGQLNGTQRRKTVPVNADSSKGQTKSANPKTDFDGHAKEPEVPVEMIELLRVRLGLDEQPERIQQQPESSNSPPLLLIHSGAGMCHFYRRIGRLNRAVNAIHDPRTFSDLREDWSSVDEMAKSYFDIIRSDKATSLKNGLILGGWSFGGVVAFELARLLIEDGHCAVKGVVLIDPPPPLDHVPMSRQTIEAATASHNSHSSRARDKNAAEFESAMKSLIIRNNMRRGALLGQFRPKRDGPMPRVILLRSLKGLKVDVEHPAEGDMWLIDRSDVQKCVGAWEELTSMKVEVLDIPGDHFTPFEPGENVDGTSVAICKACEMLD